MTNSLTNLKPAYRHWYSQIDAQLSFTGSVKQVLMHDGGRRQYATPEAISTNIDRVMERASRRILGRAAVRKGSKLQYAGCIEGGYSRDFATSSRFHVHLSIAGIPADFSLTEAAKIIIGLWQGSLWGYLDNHCGEIHDQRGWMDYTLKTLRPDNGDRFVSNFALADGAGE